MLPDCQLVKHSYMPLRGLRRGVIRLSGGALVWQKLRYGGQGSTGVLALIRVSSVATWNLSSSLSEPLSVFCGCSVLNRSGDLQGRLFFGKRWDGFLIWFLPSKTPRFLGHRCRHHVVASFAHFSDVELSAFRLCPLVSYKGRIEFLYVVPPSLCVWTFICGCVQVLLNCPIKCVAWCEKCYV